MLGFNPVASASLAAIRAAGAEAYVLATEAADAASISAQITATVSLAANDNQDIASASAQITASASLSATDAADTAAGDASAVTLASISATETQDTASVSAQIDPATCDLAATEAADSASGVVNIVAQADLAAPDTQDTATGAVNATTLISVLATEAQDATVFDAAIFSNVLFNNAEPQDIAFAYVENAAPQPNGSPLWQNVVPPAALSNSASIGILVSAPIGGAALGALGPTPSGEQLGAIWFAQPAAGASWSQAEPAPTPSSSPSIGILVSAPIGGAPFAALVQPPSGEQLGTFWSVQQDNAASWSQVTPAPPPSSAASVGILVGAPVGSAPLGGLSPRPSGEVASQIWQVVPQTYNPQQEAA